MAFTLQRLFVVYNPLKNIFKSKKSAWKTVISIVIISLLLNLWVPFLFKIRSNRYNDKYCDNNEDMFIQYFYINIIYIFLIMIVPIFVIIICNLLIVSKPKKAELIRLNLINSESITYRRNKIQKKKNKRYSISNSKKVSSTLSIISFTFCALNIPYLIAWTFIYKSTHFIIIDIISENYLYTGIKISEIFYVLNYSCNFFIYSLSGKCFYHFIISILNFNFFSILSNRYNVS